MECAIKFLDNPKNFYEPCEKLKAEITLTVLKPEKISRINCEILGYAKCLWMEGKDKTYSGRRDYMKSLFCLLGGPWDNQVDLSAGEHKFHVSLALGSDLPTSFKCLNGSIKYKIRVTVERSWRVNSRFELPFTIIRPLDLNESGKNYLRRPSKYETSKNFSLDFSSESLYLSAMILFIGYVPGQCIDVDVHVSNESKTHVKEVKVTLYKVITLISDGSKKKCKLFYEPEAKVSSNAPVPVSFKQNFKIKVEVPSLPPNIDSEIIKVNYELQIKAKTGGLSRSLRFVMPIVIGTFPLRDEDVMQPLPSYSSLLPPSYEEAILEGAYANGSDDFNPLYPIFKFGEDDKPSASKNKK